MTIDEYDVTIKVCSRDVTDQLQWRQNAKSEKTAWATMAKLPLGDSFKRICVFTA